MPKKKRRTIKKKKTIRRPAKRVRKPVRKKPAKKVREPRAKKRAAKKEIEKPKVMAARTGATRLEETYGVKDIKVLKGLEPVRQRPGMYIGGTGKEGLHHLIWECVDNAIDEAMAGYCSEIKIILEPKNIVTVEDNGRGIPIEKHPATKKSALETVMTTLHAGAKFGAKSYKVAGGLHGVGVSVVCALSDWMKTEVQRGGFKYVQEYSRGKARSGVKKIGKAKGTGTKVSFHPDPGVFAEIEFNWNKILTHLRQQAYLTPGVKITIVDNRSSTKEYSFYFEGGIVSYVKHLNKGAKLIHEIPFYVSRQIDDTLVEIALQYTDEVKGLEVSFANNINTQEGGMHLVGFRTALTRVINDYARKNDYLKEKEGNLTGEDVREGLTAVISVKLRSPQFEGQTKARLGNPEARTLVASVASDAFSEYLEKHPDQARLIMGKVLLAAKARLAAKAAKETVIRRGVMEGLTLPGKLADCSTKNPEETELFIVEGDSAGGSAKQGRDREYQAILPIRGKILNVERARLDKMLGSKEIKALIIALGCGIGDDFNIKRLRYHRVIIMTDADVDGAHIRTLLLTLFYRYLPQVIEQGHLYIAQPPLYRIQYGKKIEYAYTDEDKTEIIESFIKKGKEAQKGQKKLKKATAKGFKVKSLKEEKEALPEAGLGGEAKVIIQRYKGRGEMNPEQLWETTMDPKNRVMKQVTIEDAEKADETFDILMGDEVEPRKRFIHTHAKAVKNLDI